MYPIDLLKVRLMLALLEGNHSHYADANASDQPFARRHLHRAVKCGLYNHKDGRHRVDVARCHERHPRRWYVFISSISPPT